MVHRPFPLTGRLTLLLCALTASAGVLSAAETLRPGDLPPLSELTLLPALTSTEKATALRADLPLDLAISRRLGVTRTVKATAYNSEVRQTDNSPFITATGTRVRPGVIALSRDLLRVFPYGTRVTVQDSAGILSGRVFIVEDTMNVRLANTIDIWMPSRSQAYQWGSRTVRITALR